MDQPPRDDHLPNCQCHQRESMSEFEPACSTSFTESVCQPNDHRICSTADCDFLDSVVDFSAKNVCNWQRWSRKQLIQRCKQMERHRQQYGSASDRRSRIIRTMMPLFFTFLCLLNNVLLINAFNIDTTNPVYRVGPSRSQFGFSIAFHFRQEEPM